MEILILAVVVLAALCARSAIRRVPPGHAGMVERLGRYHRTADEGRVLLVPGPARLAGIVDPRPRTVAFAAQPLVTAVELEPHAPSTTQPEGACP